MPRIEVTITHADGSVSVEPFTPEPLPPKLSALMATADVRRPGYGRKLDLANLDAKLSNRNLSIDQRLELKAALRQAGMLA